MKKFLIIIIFTLLTVCFGCNECNCKNKDCGPSCRLQCEENKCTPGTKCCNKCSCDPFKK